MFTQNDMIRFAKTYIIFFTPLLEQCQRSEMNFQFFAVVNRHFGFYTSEAKTPAMRESESCVDDELLVFPFASLFALRRHQKSVTFA
jgi:hypothetical protein